MVPVGYVFEDDVCDNEVGPRGRKRDLKTKEEAEATGAPKRGPAKAKVEEPGAGEAQPAGLKRRGRPKKSERPTVDDNGPQTEPQNNAGMAADAEAPPEAENQPPAVRRGRSRDLGPEGNEIEGEAADSASSDRGSVRLPTSLFVSKEASTAERRYEKERHSVKLYACKLHLVQGRVLLYSLPPPPPHHARLL